MLQIIIYLRDNLNSTIWSLGMEKFFRFKKKRIFWKIQHFVSLLLSRMYQRLTQHSEFSENWNFESRLRLWVQNNPISEILHADNSSFQNKQLQTLKFRKFISSFHFETNYSAWYFMLLVETNNSISLKALNRWMYIDFCMTTSFPCHINERTAGN